MADFDSCLNFAAMKLCLDDLELKDKQERVLKSVLDYKDTIAVLPTGYDKSLIYQLLPSMLSAMFQRHMIVIVVTPLTAIMEEQVHGLRSRGVSACYLKYRGSGGKTFDCEDESESEESTSTGSKLELSREVSVMDLMAGKFSIIYTHPECLFDNRDMSRMLRSRVYKEHLGGIVIDEVHMIQEWGQDFRPKFRQLGELTCLYPHICHIAMTATAKPQTIKELETRLMYKNAEIIAVNPDRPNINLDVVVRPPNIRKLDKYNSFVQPLAQQLKTELHQFPLTIAYVENLEALGYCYQYLSKTLKEMQYNGKEPIPENRLFAQFHTDYTSSMKKLIILDMSKEVPTTRLLLATVAFGMGMNAPSVQQVLHMRPPVNLESYVQEIGRAGRCGQKAKAVLYYNNSDLASSRKGMTPEMVNYCRNDVLCLRSSLVSYFGFDEVLFQDDKEDCCKNCRNHTKSDSFKIN